MTPNHTLSEILNRRHRTLARAMAKSDAPHDLILAAGEEIASIEYHLRIVEEAERSARMGSLFNIVREISQDYDERLMNRAG